MGLMVGQLSLDSFKQGLVDDRGLLAGQYLAFVFDLTDKEPIAQEMREGASAKRNAPAGLAGAEGSRLGEDVLGLEVPYQFVDAGDFKIPAEDQPHTLGFLLNDHELAILQFISQGEGATHP